jgi:hypothetical protein
MDVNGLTVAQVGGACWLLWRVALRFRLIALAACLAHARQYLISFRTD